MPRKSQAELPESSFFWAAFHRSHNSMLLLDPARCIVAVNAAFREIIGYESEELLGRRADFFVASSGWKRLASDWVVLERSGSVIGERELIRADGQRIHVDCAAHRGVMAGRQLVLCVILQARPRPLAPPATPDVDGESLTPRELEVVERIALGQRGHEIAAELYITPATVATHTRNAMVKVGARSRAQLVAIVLCTGLLDGLDIAHDVAVERRLRCA